MSPETRSGRGDALLGSMLERRYRVDGLIARGGMSRVYRGLDTRLHRPVAIKVMDDRYADDRTFIQRFEREAQAAASLHHPNVVAVYDQGVDHEIDGDQIYLVMQLVDGCTLRDLLREQGTLPLPMAITVLESILDALSAAHSAGMVHRDIKPENVLIGRDGTVRVTDFGLVRAAAASGASSGSIILGTVAYLSPEQVTTGAAEAYTDVYAAGVVLYEMLTGTPPYVGDTALSVAYRHVNEDIPAPSTQLPDLPPAVDELIVRATRRNPADRPTNAEAFLTELRQVRNQLGIPLVEIPIPESAQRTETIRVDEDPPTEEMAAVPADVPNGGGPQGTRAILRPSSDADATQNLPPVPAEPPPEPVDRPRRGRFGLMLTGALLLIGLLSGLIWYLNTPQPIEVPNVTGKPEAVAIQVVQNAGLQPEVSKEFHNTVGAGTVISGDPEPGSQVSAGTSVKLVVSLGQPTVPDLVGRSFNDAERQLRDIRLTPQRDSNSDDFHRTIPEGHVLSVNPAPGTAVPIGTDVSVALSKGPPPVPVPDVRGMSRADAFAALQQAGFAPYDAGETFDANVQAGYVATTNPEPGTEVRLHGHPRVGVFVSNAIPVPNLNGKSVDEARQALSELGLNIEVTSLLGGNANFILGQFPLPGSNVRPGQTITVHAL